MTFLPKDRVVFTDKPFRNLKAIILRQVKDDFQNILIEFDKPVKNGHNGVSNLNKTDLKKYGKVKGKRGCCWWVNEGEIKRVKDNDRTEPVKLKKGATYKIINKKHRPKFGFSEGELITVIDQIKENVKTLSQDKARSKLYYQIINVNCLEIKGKKTAPKPNLKAGIIIMAKLSAPYAITAKGWRGKVLDTIKTAKKDIFKDDETIRVQGVKDKKQVFYVNHLYFARVRKPVKKTAPKPKPKAKPKPKTTDHVTNKTTKEVR